MDILPLLDKTSRMVWRVCLGFEKSREDRLLRNAASFSGTGNVIFREHCPRIFLEMGMADVYITPSFSEPPLSGYRQDRRSHLRSLYILTWSWLDAKSSQAHSNFMFNALFHNSFRLTESLREQYRECPHAPHPASPPLTSYLNQAQLRKTGRWQRYHILT